MATGTANAAPPPSPVGGDYPDPGVERDRYVEHQLNRTRALVKRVDLASGLGALAAGSLGLLLALVLIDHWVFGLGFWTRWFGLLFLVGGSSYFFVRRLLPLLLRSVNPVYAARTIEQSAPSLKNSLINFLLFRSHRTEVRRIVYEALREKAAADLRRVPVDMAVDRSKLIKVGCVLAGVLTAALVYTVFWPDGTWRTVRRVVIPWADLDRPAWSWVRIENVRWRVDEKEEFTPGDATVFQGQSVTVAATVRRAGSSDPVTLFYTTDDGRNVRRKVPMARGRTAADFECTLPPGDDGQGVQQNVTYSIEAGDAVSREYRIDVLSAPSIIVQKIDYDYPDYTKLPSESVRRRGDIKALEGTRVTIHARANHPIKSAYVEFDPGRSSRGGGNPDKQDRPETLSIRKIDGQEARVSFKLRLKPDRQTPKYARYRIRFTTQRGERNEQPIEHLIAVIPDLPPLVEILTPTKQTIEVPQDGRQPIKIRAVDPDFRLRRIALKGTSEGVELLEETLLDAPQGYPGQKIVEYQFVPQKLHLAVGDRLRYWAVAEDNRTSPIVDSEPEPNISRTEPDYVIRILPPQGRQPGDADRPDEEAGSPQQDDSTRGSEDQGGASGTSESGGSESGDSESGGSESGDSQSGASESGGSEAGGSESGDSESGDSQSGASESGASESGGSESGDSQSGASESGTSESGGSESGDNKSGDGQSGASESGTNQSGASESGATDSGGSEAGDGNSGESTSDQGKSGENKPGESQSGASESGGNESGGTESGGSESGGDESGGSDSAGSDAAGSKSAAEDQRPLGTGSEDDVDVFDRVRRHMREAEQRAGSSRDSSGEQGGGDAAKGSNGAKPAEQAGAQDSGGEEGKPPDGNTGEGSANKPSTSPGDESSGDQGEGGKSGDSATGSTDEQDPGEAGAGQKENGGSGSPDAQAENNPRQKKMEPGAADERSSGDAANSPSNSRRQSDSAKGEKGDKSGGGGPGGGQDAKQPGNENPGSTSPGDDGSGAAGEPGAGEESDAAGGSRIADKPTGVSGDEPGEGSGGRPGDKGGSPGGNSAGDAGGARSDDSSQEEEAPEGKQPRDRESGSGDAGADQGRPADRQEQSPTERGSGLPTGGGLPGNTQPPRIDSAGGEPGGDEADLESARKATDLTLEYLKDQEDNPDRELLDKLGWTRDDIRKFVSRWERMKEAALRRGGEGEQARKELDDALRSLGLDTGPDRLRRSAGSGADVGGSRDAGHRSSPPPQYTEQFRAYRKAAARVDQADRE